jgi:quercetin dioxygenase-like cupin family protein
MHFKTPLLVVLAALPFCTAAAAQNAPPAPAAVRTVIAATKLPTVTDGPRHFRAVSMTVPPQTKTNLPAAEDGVFYQVSGSTEVSIAGETKVLGPGEGVFIAAGAAASLLVKGGEPSTTLHFLLAKSAEGTRSGAPANASEVYRTTAPLPGLKPGSHDLNLTRVTFPPHMPSNPPHHRSGAALYYILSGTGANTVEGKTEARGPGSFIYEPSGLVHQWGNPGDAPLTFLTFNINQEGVPAVVPEAPAKSQ